MSDSQNSNQTSSVTRKELSKLVHTKFEAINERLDSGRNYSLTSTKNSVFSMLRKHLDKPLAVFFAEYERTNLSALFVPSGFDKPHPMLARETIQDYDGSKYMRVITSLRSWEELLHKLSTVEKTGVVYATLEHLIFLTRRLQQIPIVKSRVSNSALNRTDSEETTQVGKPTNYYCELCWRQSARQQAISKNGRTKLTLSHSNRFCSLHLPNPENKAAWSNYVRDRKLKLLFHQELQTYILGKPSESNFVPPPTWYVDRSPALEDEEIRKLIYDLVTSNLGSEKSLNIMTLVAHDYSVAEIVKKLGIPKSTVYRRKAEIERKVLALLDNIYLSSEDRSKTISERQKLALQKLDKASLGKLTSSMLAETKHVEPKSSLSLQLVLKECLLLGYFDKPRLLKLRKKLKLYDLNLAISSINQESVQRLLPSDRASFKFTRMPGYERNA